LVLVGILGGGVLALAIVGIAVAAWSWSQRAEDAYSVAGADSITDESVELSEDGDPAAESNPGAAASSPRTESAATKGKSPTSGKLSARSAAAARKIIDSQSKWGNIERYSIKINDVHLKVTGVWLAADTSGTWVEPKLPEAGGDNPGKYIFVEVRLFNGGSVPRKFQSWNADGELAAVMADDEGDLLGQVPVSQTPGVTRLSSLRILPNQAVNDLLVFEAPRDLFETLRLALAYSALADTKSGHIGFEVPVDLLFRQRGDAAPAASGEPVFANQAPLSSGKGDLSGVLADTSPPAAEPAKPAVEEKPKIKRPPTKEELNRQFEEFGKSPQQDKGNEPAKPPASPPADGRPAAEPQK
jgi:hypothetical protein